MAASFHCHLSPKLHIICFITLVGHGIVYEPLSNSCCASKRLSRNKGNASLHRQMKRRRAMGRAGIWNELIAASAVLFVDITMNNILR